MGSLLWVCAHLHSKPTFAVNPVPPEAAAIALTILLICLVGKALYVLAITLRFEKLAHHPTNPHTVLSHSRRFPAMLARGPRLVRTSLHVNRQYRDEPFSLERGSNGQSSLYQPACCRSGQELLATAEMPHSVTAGRQIR